MTQDVAATSMMGQKQKRALIVDDSRTACTVLARMLRNYQIEADSVQSAEAALDYLRLEQPDVIFMDHAMPGMNGLDTLKVLKAHPEYATIPVMMYTARTGEVYLSQARAFGAIDVLPKGVEQTVLEEALARLGLLPVGTSRIPAVNAVVASIEMGLQEPFANQNALSLDRMIERAFRSELRPAMSHQIHDALDEWRYEAQLANRQLAELVGQRVSNTVAEAMKPIKAELDWHRAEANRHGPLLRRQGLAVTISVLLVATVMGGVWWLPAWQKEAQRLQLLQQKLDGLSVSVASLHDEVVALADDTTDIAPSPESDLAQALRETDGNVIGKWAGVSANGAELMVVSETGYRFSLDANGAVATVLTQRFYLSPGCFGDAYAPVHDGVMMTSGPDELWYAPIGSELSPVQAVSQLDREGNCQPYQGQPLAARRLFNNQADITGVRGTRFKLDARMALASRRTP